MKPFGPDGAFHSATEPQRLRRVAVRGFGITALSGALGFAIQLIATMILARLLTPRDFGLVAMVTTFSLLLVSLATNGFLEAIVQRSAIDHQLASNLFWINVAIAVAAAAVFGASGSLVARFYRNPAVAMIAAVMSVTILLAGVSAIHIALLKKGMRFAALSSNDVAARAVSVATSVIAAWMGWGYWALVAGAIALPLSTSIGAFLMCRWTPGLPRRGAGTIVMIRFGVNTFGHFAANYCTRNLDNLLVGGFFGPQALGLYKKAYDLCVLPLSQISEPLHTVAVPTLSRLANDPPRHARYVLRALSMLAFVGMAVGALLTLIGRDLIVILLGPKWEESGRIFRFFAPGIGALLMYVTYGWIHLSIGRADRFFRWGIIEFVVIGSLFLLGLPFGVRGVASAWSIAAWVLWIPALMYAGRPIELSIWPIIGAVSQFVFAAAAAAALSALIVRNVPFPLNTHRFIGPLTRIAGTSVVFAGLYLALVGLVHWSWAPLREVADIARELLPQRFSRVVALGPAQAPADSPL